MKLFLSAFFVIDFFPHPVGGPIRGNDGLSGIILLQLFDAMGSDPLCLLRAIKFDKCVGLVRSQTRGMWGEAPDPNMDRAKPVLYGSG